MIGVSNEPDPARQAKKEDEMKLYILETHTEDSSGEPLPKVSLTRAGAFWRLDRLLSYKTDEIDSRWIDPDQAALILSSHGQYDPGLFEAWRKLPTAAREQWITRLPFGTARFPGALIPADLAWIEALLALTGRQKEESK